jgi:Predicted nucleotide-binding protein containing TIR-like domain
MTFDTPESADDLAERLRQLAIQARGSDVDALDLGSWKTNVRRCLAAVQYRFSGSDGPSFLTRFDVIRFQPRTQIPAGRSTMDAAPFLAARRAGVVSTCALLDEVVEYLRAQGPRAPGRLQSAAGETVFIVHGHDTAVRAEVARTIQRLTRREPVILHEQADGGRTIIEKFEEHAVTAGFAVVLLTADDVGRPNGGNEQPRARQNVVFEAGYFTALLGRARVMLLKDDEVEEPSDLNGVIYTPLDKAGAWKTRLGQELRAANIEADLNNL